MRHNKDIIWTEARKKLRNCSWPFFIKNGGNYQAWNGLSDAKVVIDVRVTILPEITGYQRIPTYGKTATYDRLSRRLVQNTR